jgi:hypothetical protein
MVRRGEGIADRRGERYRVREQPALSRSIARQRASSISSRTPSQKAPMRTRGRGVPTGRRSRTGAGTRRRRSPPDWAHLTAFYDFPAEHWRHLRTSNAIESSFATVKLRTRVTKGAGSKKPALAMAYKLLDAPQERWRRFNGHELVADVLAGATFKDGIRVTDDTNHDETPDENVAA